MSSMFLDIFWLAYKEDKTSGFVTAMVVLNFIVKPVTIWNCSQQLRKGISLPHSAGIPASWHPVASAEREPLYDNVPDSPGREGSPVMNSGGNVKGNATKNFDQL